MLKFYSIVVLCCILLNSQEQTNLLMRHSKALEEPDLKYRIRRVWYERYLKTDSVTAIKIKADEAEQEGIQQILEDFLPPYSYVSIHQFNFASQNSKISTYV